MEKIVEGVPSGPVRVVTVLLEVSECGTRTVEALDAMSRRFGEGPGGADGLWAATTEAYRLISQALQARRTSGAGAAGDEMFACGALSALEKVRSLLGADGSVAAPQ